MWQIANRVNILNVTTWWQTCNSEVHYVGMLYLHNTFLLLISQAVNSWVYLDLYPAKKMNSWVRHCQLLARQLPLKSCASKQEPRSMTWVQLVHPQPRRRRPRNVLRCSLHPVAVIHLVLETITSALQYISDTSVVQPMATCRQSTSP